MCEMRSSRLRAFATSLFLLALASCGFQPLQSQAYRGTLAVDMASVDVEVGNTSTHSMNGVRSAGAGRYSELLEAEIQDQINPTATRSQKRFKITIGYSEQESGVFVNPDGTVSRGDLIYASHYTITRLADGKRVADGSISRISSYNTAPNADYSSYVSIEDARKRGVMELAQDYKLRLATLLPTLNNPDATALESKVKESLPELHPVKTNENRPAGY